MFYLDNLKKWLESNTYNSLDYSNLEHIYLYKKNRTISLVIPTLNEESTIEYIIDKIFNELNCKFQILDEVIIIDGGSTA